MAGRSNFWSRSPRKQGSRSLGVHRSAKAAAGTVLVFSPPTASNRSSNAVNENDDPGAVLELAHFSRPPFITFDNVEVGSSKTCTLTVVNPPSSSSDVIVRITKFPKTAGFMFEEDAFALLQNERRPLSITWTPAEEGRIRDTVTFQASSGITTRVTVLGTAVVRAAKMKKKRGNGTKASANAVCAQVHPQSKWNGNQVVSDPPERRQTYVVSSAMTPAVTKALCDVTHTIHNAGNLTRPQHLPLEPEESSGFRDSLESSACLPGMEPKDFAEPYPYQKETPCFKYPQATTTSSFYLHCPAETQSFAKPSFSKSVAAVPPNGTVEQYGSLSTRGEATPSAKALDLSVSNLSSVFHAQSAKKDATFMLTPLSKVANWSSSFNLSCHSSQASNAASSTRPLSNDVLRKEIQHLCSTLQVLVEIQELGGTPMLGRKQVQVVHSLVQRNDEPVSLLLGWCQAVLAFHNIEVKNFTSSFADGRALCFLIHHYNPLLLPKDRINQLTTQADAAKDAARAIPSFNIYKFLENERENWRSIFEAMDEMEAPPGLDMRDVSNTIPDENAVVSILTSLGSRLVMAMGADAHAARTLQLAWRTRKARQLRNKRQAERVAAAVKVQRQWRRILEKRKRRRDEAAVRIQALVRGFLQRKRQQEEKVAALRHARIIQRWFRGCLAARRERQAENALGGEQQLINRHDLATLSEAAIKIQSAWRGLVARKQLSPEEVDTCHSIRERLSSASSSSSGSQLSQRFRPHFGYLLKFQPGWKCESALEGIESASRLLPSCAKLMATKENVSVLCRIAKGGNRSVAYQNTMLHIMSILLNLAKFQETVEAVWNEGKTYPVVLNLLHSHCTEQPTSTFQKALALMWIFSGRPAWLKVMKRDASVMRTLQQAKKARTRWLEMEGRKASRRTRAALMLAGDHEEDEMALLPAWVDLKQQKRTRVTLDNLIERVK